MNKPVQIHLLVLDRASQAFEEHVVYGLPTSIHTNTDFCFFQPLRERLSRELDALIGIEALRRALYRGLCQDRQTELTHIRIRQ